ncbi:MAG: UDP-N-acetylglucosamine--N-acetylmuramyl-(pentapeptide) pyrophosphoryl-undecaprenol N-acetylglucosamine transferase [Sedimentisphaerales bacterium]|jgi:UDP-N-acetylglucosamine--N-acetylmuramyl-(pentapeptide) pyrophosphoryl-undecaprenol N-acetylglucosamine transferase
MAGKSIFFAGGGTGGHIYPALAIAEKIAELDPTAKIHFFISSRDIDKHVLSKTAFEYTALPAVGLSIRPDRFLNFCKMFLASQKIAAEMITKSENPVVVGVGGFVAAPVCRAAYKSKTPLFLLNVDIIPGKANKLIGRWVQRIFVQFEETAEYFGKQKTKVTVTGCPLRSSFNNPNPQKAKDALGLDYSKKILLITGASTGSQNINRTICSLLEKLSNYADNWQIVHLTGRANFDQVSAGYANAPIRNKVVDYYDDMPNLLAAADIVIGRSGAVSVAEYAAAATPSICMPYPYHNDLHQYLNAGKLVEAGAAVIVDDVGDDKDRCEWLWEELEPLLKDETARRQMKDACKAVARKNAAKIIAEAVLGR